MKAVEINIIKGKYTYNIIDYAIQGRNYEIIHLLEDRKEIKDELNIQENQQKYLEISIKMHHNEIFEYFMTIFNAQVTEEIIDLIIKYRNYQLFDQLIKSNQVEIKDNSIITNIFKCFCKNRDEEIVKILINLPNIDMNSVDEIIFHSLLLKKN